MKFKTNAGILQKKFASASIFFYLCCMENAIEYIKELYGEKAIPHKRTEPFKSNDLMTKVLRNDLSVRVFSPATPDGWFIVEYYENPKMVRLDFNLNTKTVRVCNRDFFVVAKYVFERKPNTFSVSFVEGKNFYFEQVRDALKTYFDVLDGFKWVEV